ncbi:MAG TPA: sugar phosphate isomerase/epimerase [Candidatus Acidoferrales bacterium]|jgi:sugar phosphate isomerase/epimerase|nr:sugar phosphate isomerase/epimerase [Candidatus Acidoferrales bacterium]
MAAVLTRRHFVAAASSLATLRAAGSSMKLSITVRIAEAAGSNQKTTMGFEEVVAIAKKTGYEAIDMRASQGGIQTPKEKLRDMRKALDKYGIKVSCVTGDFDVPSNNDKAPDGLRNIGPYLDVAEILGADLIRIGMKKEEDIAAAQRACDQARERKIRLGHESHQGTLFETVAGSLDILKRVNRPNFGLIYEAGNWMVTGQDYGPETIKKFKPWILNVFIQNYRITPNGKSTVATWTKGPVKVDLIGSWEGGGVDYPKVFRALHSIGYNGYVTAFAAFSSFATPQEAAAKSYEHLKPLATKAS